MPFQFQCPQGHLLEGDESQAGQPVNCPVCQMLFLIPAPPPGAAAAAPEPAEAPAPPTPKFSMEQPPESRIVHIPCPKGHELEVPPEMFGQDVLCPHCQAQFTLRERDSVEWKRRRDEEQHRRDVKLGNTWLYWAIAIAIMVVLGLGILIATSR